MSEQAKQDAKAKRLAEQLRENLRRRKAQARALKGGKADGLDRKIKGENGN